MKQKRGKNYFQIALGAAGWKRNIAAPSRGFCAEERTSAGGAATNWKLAVCFSCSHLAKTSPNNG